MHITMVVLQTLFNNVQSLMFENDHGVRMNMAPFIAIIAYMIYPTKLRINKYVLYYFAITHNTALIVFSAWTFVSIVDILYRYGIVFESNYYFQIPEFDRVMFLFYLSKYYEFFDTFILYLLGKQPILLQKYHHIGAVICWHLTYTNKVDSIWIPSLANSFIHTIMYSYYLGSLLKIKQVRIIRQFLTTLQLAQLVSTMVASNYYYGYPVETFKNYKIMWVVNAYNTFLIFLFISFYCKNYIKTKTNED